MPHRSWFKRVVHSLAAVTAILACITLVPTGAQAQNTNSGTVIGQVTDAQGKAIVGAVITITNAATSTSQTTISNSAGRYTFVNIPGANYTLDVKKDGFKEAVVKNQYVVVGKPLTINVPMQVGSATQTVEVTATGAELQTMNSTVGDTISGDAIIKLPNLNRDANSLTMLQPNTQPDGGVSGADSDQNSFTLDGGSNSNDMDGNNADYTPATGGQTSGVIPTPAESVEQFSVGVSNQSADVNSAAGSSVAIQTKRGTDTLHGSAYDYYLGSYLGANTWANDANVTANPDGTFTPNLIPKAKSHQNRFGASLGGPILPDWLGGKTYLFGNFEGRRFPSTTILNRATPTDLMRAGVIQALNASGWESYNLNPKTVTVNGVAYQPTSAALTNPAVAGCAPYKDASGNMSTDCDPRHLGMNPVVAALWKNMMPEPNVNATTGHNTATFEGNVVNSLRSNFFVARMDHDFGSKNHFSATYHFYSYNPITTSQTDIGGGVPGDKFGVPTATTQRPELPTMTTVAWTSSPTSNLTNAFHYSYLRNFWQWGGSYLQPQAIPGFSGLGGALEIGGESHYNPLIPYNVNTQNVRTRFWDGIGQTFSDDLSLLHGNHLFQFGGKYTHQWDYHQRNDNGGGIMANNVYQISGGQGVANTFIPTDFTGSSTSGYKTAYNEVLGIVSQPQTLYTRSGPKLTLQPLGTPMFDQSYIPLYNVYFSDAWHIKPSLTLTYGTGYTIEMPPHEALGKQVELVDGAGNLITTADYLAAQQRAALQGQTYTPTLGFATVGNVGQGLKYPYRPFYGGLSPRVSMAWNPNISGGFIGELVGGNKSVFRGGWSRIYGRLNGVDQVLVPLLGTGLGQPVECIGALSTGTCAGPGGANPATAFRIGPTSLGLDGMTAPLGNAPTTNLPQPYYPGVIQNGVPNAQAASGEFLDPNFRPDRSDEWDLTWQRQLTPAFSTEIGYTGRIIRNEYQAHNLDAVPYMLTAGGQQFQSAFANLWKQIAAGSSTFSAQPFFETAFGGQTSAFCSASINCTSAVAAKYGPNGRDYIDPSIGNDVYSLWASMNQSSSWTLGRTFPSSPTTCPTPGAGGCPTSGLISGGGQLQAIFANDALGYGNYNSFFWTVTARNWHNLTASSNFTWSRSMGTGQVDQATSSYTVTDPWNLHAMYGPQYDDTPLNYNAYLVWEPGSRTQNGIIGHLANGWTLSPILTWRLAGQSGGWTDVNIGGDCASFGETDCNAGGTQETAIKTAGFTNGSNFFRGVNPTGQVGTDSAASNGGYSMNRFGTNGAAFFSKFRPMVLGLDTTGQSGLLPGFSQTNVAFAIFKDLAISERFATEISAQATNVFNHFSPTEEGQDIQNPASFGVISGNALDPRTVEVGLRIHW